MTGTDTDHRHALVISEYRHNIGRPGDEKMVGRHVLCAESDEERDMWINAIQNQIIASGGGGIHREGKSNPVSANHSSPSVLLLDMNKTASDGMKRSSSGPSQIASISSSFQINKIVGTESGIGDKNKSRLNHHHKEQFGGILSKSRDGSAEGNTPQISLLVSKPQPMSTLNSPFQNDIEIMNAAVSDLKIMNTPKEQDHMNKIKLSKSSESIHSIESSEENPGVVKNKSSHYVDDNERVMMQPLPPPLSDTERTILPIKEFDRKRDDRDRKLKKISNFHWGFRKEKTGEEKVHIHLRILLFF